MGWLITTLRRKGRASSSSTSMMRSYAECAKRTRRNPVKFPSPFTNCGSRGAFPDGSLSKFWLNAKETRCRSPNSTHPPKPETHTIPILNLAFEIYITPPCPGITYIVISPTLSCVHECVQDAFTQRVLHQFKQFRSNEFKVISGFYTDQMMKDELKFSPQLGPILCITFAPQITLKPYKGSQSPVCPIDLLEWKMHLSS